MYKKNFFEVVYLGKEYLENKINKRNRQIETMKNLQKNVHENKDGAEVLSAEEIQALFSEKDGTNNNSYIEDGLEENIDVLDLLKISKVNSLPEKEDVSIEEKMATVDEIESILNNNKKEVNIKETRNKGELKNKTKDDNKVKNKTKQSSNKTSKNGSFVESNKDVKMRELPSVDNDTIEKVKKEDTKVKEDGGEQGHNFKSL